MIRKNHSGCSQVSCKGSVDSTITDLLEKALNKALAIRNEHLLLMPHVG